MYSKQNARSFAKNWKRGSCSTSYEVDVEISAHVSCPFNGVIDQQWKRRPYPAAYGVYGLLISTTRAQNRSTDHAGCIPCKTKHVCISQRSTLNVVHFNFTTKHTNEWRTHKIFPGIEADRCIHSEAIFFKWPNFTVCKDRGIIGEILSNTLECIFSFADAFHDAAIIKVKSKDVADIIIIKKTSKNLQFNL